MSAYEICVNAKLNRVTLQRRADVIFLFLLGLSYIGWPLWDLCECQAECSDTAKITEATKSLSCR